MEKEVSMRLTTLAAIAFTATFATLASAQDPAARQTTDNGFFRPAGDPNLTAPRPAQRTRPTEDLVAEDRVQANAQGAAADRPADPGKVMQWTEQQMNRSEQEAQYARPAPGTPQPINGAFTGSTNERDRR
jgi:hypothetical protein